MVAHLPHIFVNGERVIDIMVGRVPELRVGEGTSTVAHLQRQGGMSSTLIGKSPAPTWRPHAAWEVLKLGLGTVLRMEWYM